MMPTAIETMIWLIGVPSADAAACFAIDEPQLVRGRAQPAALVLLAAEDLDDPMRADRLLQRMRQRAGAVLDDRASRASSRAGSCAATTATNGTAASAISVSCQLRYSR